jgi:hypothetical protein
MTEYTGRKFDDDSADEFVNNFISTIPEHERECAWVADDAITKAWAVSQSLTDEEYSHYNSHEVLRWVFQVMKHFVGDDKDIPITWNRKF